MRTLRPSSLHPRLCFVAAAFLPLGLSAANEGVPPPHTHVLFMGTDLSVRQEKKLYRVEDVMGSEFKIRVDQKEVYVPTRSRQIDLHVDAGLKLVGLSVQLDQLQSGPAYTHANDPLRKLEEANRNTQNLADMQEMSEAEVPRAEGNLAAAINNAFHMTNKEQAQRSIDDAKRHLDDSVQQAESVHFSMNTDLNNVGEAANRMALANGNFDAMEVSFKISSPVELEQPYMVILFKFHDPDAKPGVNGLVIHAQALEPIDAKPRYVRVLQGGLPLGFKFVDCAVHIYNRGGELATNLSDKRVELTRDEARRYVVVEHLGAHKGATLPAAAVRGTLSRAQRQGLTQNQQTRTFYAKVAKDGTVWGVFTDAECTVPLDDAGTRTALGEVLFAPALDQGKAVDGVARVRFADI